MVSVRCTSFAHCTDQSTWVSASLPPCWPFPSRRFGPGIAGVALRPRPSSREPRRRWRISNARLRCYRSISWPRNLASTFGRAGCGAHRPTRHAFQCAVRLRTPNPLRFASLRQTVSSPTLSMLQRTGHLPATAAYRAERLRCASSGSASAPTAHTRRVGSTDWRRGESRRVSVGIEEAHAVTRLLAARGGA